MDWLKHNETEPIKPIPSGMTIRKLAYSIMNRLDISGTQKYRRIVQLIIECVSEEIRLYDATTTEILFAKVDETGIVQMPPDCLDYIKIGCNLGGQFYILGMNENIVLSRATMCGVNVDDIQRGGLAVFAPVDGYYFSDYFGADGSYYGGLYGLGGGFTNPQYRWDEKLKRFQLNGSCLLNREVIVEYQSTGVGAGTILETPILEPIRRFVEWQIDKRSRNARIGDVQMSKEEYDESIQKLRTYTNMFTRQQLLDVFYKNLKQGPKR